MAIRAITSCQMDECAEYVSFELSEFRMWADRPICYSCYIDGGFGQEDWEDLPPCLPIDYEGLEGMVAFLAELLTIYAEGAHQDIEGCEFQDLLNKHGLAEQGEITSEECEEDWAQDWGYEPGDIFYRYTPAMQALMRRAK